MTPSAEVIARAVVAAAMLLGQDPTRAFEANVRKGRDPREKGPRAVRLLAAHGIRARMGAPAGQIAGLLRVTPQELAPSQQKKFGITTDQLLIVAEALGDRADEGRSPRERFMEPWSGAPTTAAPQRRSAAAGVECARMTVKPQVVKWATWFLDARWPLGTVARLFDVDPEALLTAVENAG